MLAPLDLPPAHCQPSAESLPDLHSENADLRQALRDSRQRLRRSAWESTRQIARLQRYLSGVAITELGQALMRLAENNERLKVSAQRAALLERTIATVQTECRELNRERETLLAALQHREPCA